MLIIKDSDSERNGLESGVKFHHTINLLEISCYQSLTCIQESRAILVLETSVYTWVFLAWDRYSGGMSQQILTHENQAALSGIPSCHVLFREASGAVTALCLGQSGSNCIFSSSKWRKSFLHSLCLNTSNCKAWLFDFFIEPSFMPWKGGLYRLYLATSLFESPPARVPPNNAGLAIAPMPTTCLAGDS